MQTIKGMGFPEMFLHRSRCLCALFFSLYFPICLGVFEFDAYAAPRTRSSEFLVPEKLRPRVDFWKDIFTVYGKSQMVVHHREYPQVRFGVIDLTREFEQLTPVQFEKLKKERGIQEIARFKGILRNLAAGNGAQTPEEEEIRRQMRFLPGGASKYQTVIDQDLIRTQTGIKEKYQEAVRRAGRYLPIMENIFREYRLPIELTRLPFIESSFDYEAYSSVGAAGIWQFMRRTAMNYMTVNSIVDERRDPIEATRAAARYLEQAHNTLGTWPLALTSYNHGVAGVARKVRQIGTSNLVDIIEHPYERVFGFASTNFYPEFLAALEIYDNYQEYFPGLQLYPALSLTNFQVPHAIYIKTLATRFGIPIDELRKVNYAVSEKVWTGRAPLPRGYVLKIPSPYDSRVAGIHLPDSDVPLPPAPAASSVYGGKFYRVRKGDSLLGIGKKYGVSVSTLKELNKLTSEQLLIGQLITIKPKETSRPPVVSTKKTVKAQASYKVQSGDNLWSIARRLGVSVQALKSANKLKKNDIRHGQVLRIP